ncbi:hypothetical protein FKM82_012300 [Ascaphus truei]
MFSWKGVHSLTLLWEHIVSCFNKWLGGYSQFSFPAKYFLHLVSFLPWFYLYSYIHLHLLRSALSLNNPKTKSRFLLLTLKYLYKYISI